MGSPCFADVLADALHTTARPATAVTTGSAPTFAAAPPHPFLFFAAPALSRAHAVCAFGAAARTFPQRPRPVRALTATQQQSLDSLNALGAQLTPDFMAQELRRAYRWLAHRVHPDRQHDCGEAERARRSRLFVTVTAHYHRLRALVDPR